MNEPSSRLDVLSCAGFCKTDAKQDEVGNKEMPEP